MDTVYITNLSFKKYIDSVKLSRSEVLTYYDFIRIVETDYDCKFVLGSTVGSESHLQFRNPADATMFVLKWS